MAKIAKRYIHDQVLHDLKEKMVFISGPRQVGKTTFAKYLAEKEYKNFEYLNWDSISDRRIILSDSLPADKDLIIFDEIHKYKKWKNYLKGQFDKHKDKFDILVTGSSRLNIYQKGADSLMGRYFHFRLHPFSLAELLGEYQKNKPFKELKFSYSNKNAKIFSDLYKFGGFPEPLFAKSNKVLRRWQNSRLDRLITEDIRDITLLRDLPSIQILSDILPSKVGSLLSANSLRSFLEVTHKTVSLWLDVLENFYYHFRIRPFTLSKKINHLKKEPKMYLWDWSVLESDSAKLENIVASHLLKFAHFLEDAEGYKAELFFVRDREGREIDFLFAVDRKPWFAVEVKMSDKTPSKHLLYFKDKLKIPFSYQVVGESGIDLMSKDIRIISADKFLSAFV